MRNTEINFSVYRWNVEFYLLNFRLNNMANSVFESSWIKIEKNIQQPTASVSVTSIKFNQVVLRFFFALTDKIFLRHELLSMKICISSYCAICFI